MSIQIINTFVEMRRFITNNALLSEEVSDIELKQLEYQKSTGEESNKVFRHIEDHAESEQEIFFNGQIYGTLSLITSIVRKAQREIIPIGGYVDVDTLNMLTKKSAGVDMKIYIYANIQLTEKDETKLNTQHLTLIVRKAQVFHGRSVLLDGGMAHHIGASIRGAGKKCFATSLTDDPGIVMDSLNRSKAV